ncbi:MAG: sugar nucleotide-binding protein [Oscillospiraceae bacterium]|nr:sugar nucleotide-binding protein [Oscillospiraceae bacterium]
MKIILTGAKGFVGIRALEHLMKKGHEVECIASEELRGELKGERYDALVCRFERFQPDAVIHTAAISDMGQAESDPDASFLANVRLPEIMAILSEKFGCKLISCSSDQVYNGTTHILVHSEDEQCAPANVYGRHKLEGERRIAEISPNAVSLRLTWMYDIPTFRGHTNFGFPLQLIRAAAEDKPLKFSVNHFRGMTYVRSVAENMEKAISLPGGVYNFGSENTLDMYSTALAFMRSLGLEDRAEKLIIPFEEKENSLAMDCTRLKSCGVSFESTVEGVEKLLRDYEG